MDEMDILFSCLDEKEAELLLKDIDIPSDPQLCERIKARTGISRPSAVRAFPIRRLLPFAAVFCIVLTFAITLGIKTELIPPLTSTTAAPVTTQQPPEENPLMAAISTGNDDIIQKLLTVPGVITKETMDFALNLSDTLSYNTIHEIALRVRDSLGSTGLDALVEGALLGDSQKVITELDARTEMSMTPFEKLAFFFSVAFCSRETVEKFVSRGYDIGMTDASGNSIYAIAKKYGNEDTMQYAVSMGITS